MQDVYGPHPYGRRVRGRADTVQSLGRADLVAFLSRWFTPASLTVVTVGSLPAQ
jgi:predicted Zn-dependent peptidase